MATSFYQSPRASTSPTKLPPISTLPYNNSLLPPIIPSTGNGSFDYKGPSNVVERNEQQYRYPSSSSISMNTPQATPTTPYSTSSTSSFFSPSPLPQQPPPTQPPTPLPQSQPSYYQRSPPTSYFSPPTYSSYPPYPQQSHSPAQQTSRRPPQQIQQHYPSQQYSLQPSQITSHHPHSQSTSQQTPTPIRPYQRNHNSQNVISEPFVTVTPELNNRPPRRRRRPPFSYSSLIAQAILDSPDRRLTLREVYQWIMERYPQLYKADDTGWQNTIRHNLSLNKCFKKVPRSDTELGHSTSSSTASKGKGGYWTIDPEYMSSYHDGVFARGGVQKRRPGEVGLHPMGGPVLGDDDSGGSESPSDSMAGRLVDVVDDDGESGYHHHHSHHLNRQQHHYHHMHHNGVVGNTSERLPLTLTVSTVPVSPSTSLITPPLTSNLLQNKPKKFYPQKRHSSEPSFANLSPSSPPYTSSVNASGSNSGRYNVFHVTDLNDKSNTDHLDGMGISPELYQEKMQTLSTDRQFRVINNPSSNRDMSPYSVGSRSGGQDSEWNMNDLQNKREIDQREGSRNSPYYYGSHSMIPASRGVTDLQQAVGDIDSSNSPISSMAGSSSMKIRDLLN